MMTTQNSIPTASVATGQLECQNYELLKKAEKENLQLQHEYDTVLNMMEFLFSLTELWAKHNGFISSGSRSKEDVEKEFADGKDKVRTLFNKLIKTGEPAFLDRLFRGMNLPKDFQHFI